MKAMVYTQFGPPEVLHFAEVEKPVIDRVYPLEQMVEAHRYVDTGQKRAMSSLR